MWPTARQLLCLGSIIASLALPCRGGIAIYSLHRAVVTRNALHGKTNFANPTRRILDKPVARGSSRRRPERPHPAPIAQRFDHHNRWTVSSLAHADSMPLA